MSKKPCNELSLDDFGIDAGQVKQLERAGFRTIEEIVHFLEQSLGCGTILPLSANQVSLTGIDFHFILSRLKELGCWPDASQFKDISLEDFDVSEDCRQSLYRVGFSTLHELVWTLEQLLIGGPTFSGAWLRHWGEIFDGLRAIGFWPSCRPSQE
jgi:hypothetical protein